VSGRAVGRGAGTGRAVRGERAVVVGGGIAGLATAAVLAREGLRTTLLEARDEVGGRAGVWRSEGFTFDTGPSWYLMPEVFDHFFRLLGTSADAELDLVRLDPAYRVFFERFGPLDVRSDRDEAVALFERVEPGAGARLAGYLDSASDAYRAALDDFLYTTFARPLRVVRPGLLPRAPRLVRLLTESLQRRVERTVDDVRLRQVLGYPAVFLGASPRLTPAMYHLMSHLDLTDGVLYPRGGMGTVVERVHALAVEAGVDVRTGADVVAITTEPVGASGGPVGGGRSASARLALRARRWPGRARARATGVRYRDRRGEVVEVPADVVVSAADLHHTETALLPPHLRSRPERWWRRRVAGPSAVMVLLGVRGGLPQLPHHALFFAHDWDATFARIFHPEPGADPRAPLPDPTSLYVSRTTATDPGAAPDGAETVVVLVPVPADVRLGAGGVGGGGDPWVEATADAAIAQVAAWAGVPDLAERVVVRRTIGPADYARDLRSWRGTALGPAHNLRQSAFLRAGNASRRVAGLYYAGGSTIPGIGLPMCLISAELVVKRLRGDTSARPLPEPLGVPTPTGPVRAGPAPTGRTP